MAAWTDRHGLEAVGCGGHGPLPTAVAQGTLPLPWEEQGNSVEEIISVLGEVADFRRWAASMRQLHTSNAIAAQFGGDALLSRKGAA